MKTKKTRLLIGISVLIMSCNLSNKQYEIHGNLANDIDNTVVYLHEISSTDPNQSITIDSIEVKNNQFIFTGQKDISSIGYISFKNQEGKFPLFIENGKTMIDLDLDNPIAFTLTGTVNNEQLDQLRKSINLYKHNQLIFRRDNQSTYLAALQTNDTEELHRITEEFNKLKKQEETVLDEYFSINNNTLTSLNHLYNNHKDNPKYKELLPLVYKNLSENDKKSNIAQLSKIVIDKK